MVKKIRRKVKKIAMKASLISMELEDITEENKEYKEKLSNDFSDEFRFIEWKKRQEEDAEPRESKIDIPSEEVEVDISEAPSEIKKIYRCIALKTHPDRIEDEYLNSLFVDAVEAMETENWMLLVEIAGELRLDIDFLSDETCETIEQSIAKNASMIKNIKNTFSYMWAKQKTDKDRKIFTSLFYKQFKIDEQEFKEWLESNPLDSACSSEATHD